MNNTAITRKLKQSSNYDSRHESGYSAVLLEIVSFVSSNKAEIFVSLSTEFDGKAPLYVIRISYRYSSL